MRTSNILLLLGFIMGVGCISCDRETAVEPVDVQSQKTGDLTVEVFLCNPQDNPACQGELQPVSGARVVLIPEDPSVQQDSFLSKLTLADGKAEFQNLYPGTFQISTEYIDERQQAVETVFANTEKYHRVVFLKE